MSVLVPGSGSFLPVFCRLRHVLSNSLATLDDFRGLLFVLLERCCEVPGVHLVHVRERVALHQLPGDGHVLLDTPIHEVRPILLGRSHALEKGPDSRAVTAWANPRGFISVGGLNFSIGIALLAGRDWMLRT